ncbi:MAG: histidine kinase [Acidimicrobiales bacterium]
MAESCNRRFTPLHVLRLGFVAFYLGFAVLVLAMGGLSAWANASPSFHDSLHEWGLGDGLYARAFQAMADASHGSQPLGQLAIDYGFSLFNLALAGFLLWLRPRDRTAVLLAVGMIGTAAVFNLQAYGVYEAFPKTDDQEGVHHFFQLTAAISYIFALLLFPDGRLPPRGWVWGKAVLYVPLISLVSWQAFRQEGTNRTIAVILYFGLLTPVAGVLGQAYRSRRSLDTVERQQSRLLFWALVPAVFLALFVLTRQVQDTAFETYQGREIDIVPIAVFRVFQLVFALIPVALFIGILRYKLWNIERVISRALLYGLLAAFVTAVYVAVVVVVGGAIGSQGGNLWLSILATGLVAVAFQPVKERVDRLANRLVYGKRATPYEVLSEMASRMGEALATDELLSRMARVIAEGTAAARADVWLVVGNEMRPACSWPAEDAGPGSPPEAMPLVDGGELPAIAGATMSVAVRHHGEPLGALAVTKPAGETMAPTEEKLLADVASQAGLMLRNVRLNAELVARLDELRASRVRLLATQDEARRRLERNLHDGAQQQLVALKVMVGLAEQVAAAGQPIDDILAEIRTNASDALENLRDLARGIYPPLLAAEGLPTALRGQATRVPFALVVEAVDVARYPQEVEAAVYFCCLEAFQNAAKHAQASTVTVRVVGGPQELRFTIADDGQGCDLVAAKRGSGLQNMADRMDALEGTLDLWSEPSGGTVVEGWVPCEPLVPGGAEAPAPAAQEGRPEGTPLTV